MRNVLVLVLPAVARHVNTCYSVLRGGVDTENQNITLSVTRRGAIPGEVHRMQG